MRPILDPARLWLTQRFWRALTLELSTIWLGLAWFVALVGLFGVGLALAFTLAGPPLLGFTIRALTWGAHLERRRLAALTGEALADPARPLPTGSPAARLREAVRDPAVRRDLCFLLALTPIGLVQVAVALLAPASIALVAMPAYFWLPSRLLGPGVFPVVEGQVIDTLPKAVIVSVAGLILVVVVPRLVLATASTHVAVARRLLAEDRDDALAERVETLTSNRARAMDAVAAERQRIERDLHDGAQQRLVALALDLGRARSKMETDPAAAAGLVAEAHEEAKLALAEIRDLARGIYPAVLTDRGLDASISALAARCPISVDAHVRLSGRLSAPIESTAYFVVAEALTNVARRASASRVRVDLRLEGGTLIVEVTDDGGGGADPGRGSGLRGLADRLAAFDGTLRVDSPAGGPTCVRAELPCGS